MTHSIIEEPQRISDAEEIMCELRSLVDFSYEVSNLSTKKLSLVIVERPKAGASEARAARTMSPLFSEFRDAISNARACLDLIKDQLEHSELSLREDL